MGEAVGRDTAAEHVPPAQPPAGAASGYDARMRSPLVLACLLTLASQLAPAAGRAQTPAAVMEADALLDNSWKLTGKDALGLLQSLRRAVTLYEKAYGPKDPRVAKPLKRLGQALYGAGDAPGALKVYERAAALDEKALGPDHLEVGQSLSWMAIIRSQMGDYAEAEALHKRVMAIHVKAYGPRSPQLATFLLVQASSFTANADYARAYQLIKRAVEIAAGNPGQHGEALVGPLMQLAWIAKMRGRTDEALAALRRAYTLSEKRPGGEILAATLLEQQASIIKGAGRAAEAEAIFDRAEAAHLAYLKTNELKFGKEHAMTNSSLQLLSGHYRTRGRLDKALPILERTLATSRRLHGPESLATSGDEILLGEALRQQGKYDEGRKLLRHALAIYEKTIGEKSASGPLQMLAMLEHDSGRFAEARGLTERARRGFTSMFGPRHLVIAQLLQREALLWWAQGKMAPAIAQLRESMELMEPLTTAVLSGGTEEDKRQFLDNMSYQVHAVAALHALAAPKDRKALQLALTTVLRRKGRALDALGSGLAALRKRLTPEDRELLDKLAAARGSLAKLVLKAPQNPPPEFVRQVAELERAVRDLEQALGARSAEVRAQVTPVTVEAVQAALPRDAALIELLAVQPPQLKKSAAPPDPATRRYVVYVLPAKGAPSWVDLGLVSDLDPLVTRLREALASKRADVRDPAQALGEKVMKPLRPLLGAARHLFVSPDGALNLVPFGALVDDQGQFELQRYTFTYLTSGRDLLRLKAQLPSRERATIVADPDFGPPGAVTKGEEGPMRGRRSVDLLAMNWTALPGTAEEGRTVSALLKEARVISGAAATEAALKRVAGPRVLHVATHGFFLQPEEESTARVPENPLLRSGLLLAGANRRESGTEDGILTALEASGLDLGGTKLVVLSACETGLGQVRAGEGVYGLRRALIIAGAESQVMSLWKVDDKVTRDLMVEFYKRLLAGQGRSAALREAQLAILGRPGTDNPFYWAGFIPAGAWGPMR